MRYKPFWIHLTGHRNPTNRFPKKIWASVFLNSRNGHRDLNHLNRIQMFAVHLGSRWLQEVIEHFIRIGFRFKYRCRRFVMKTVFFYVFYYYFICVGFSTRNFRIIRPSAFFYLQTVQTFGSKNDYGYFERTYPRIIILSSVVGLVSDSIFSHRNRPILCQVHRRPW